ncbi:MAG: hypothetical protein H6717_30915 [Polyangiaceae bacterium]|nr:hypothetical protein [Polyangiaceae bacterium]
MQARYLTPLLLFVPLACAAPTDSGVLKGNGGSGNATGSGGGGGVGAVGGGGGIGATGGNGGFGAGGTGTGGFGAGGTGTGGFGAQGGTGGGGVGGGTGGFGATGGGGGSGGTTVTSVECNPCSTDSQCGDGQSAGCWIGNGTGQPAYCALDCTLGQVCPSGSSCIQDTGDQYKTCIPDGGSCGGGPTTVQCQPCASDSTCGDGQSAGCWLQGDSTTPGYCALDCTNSNACPSGATCMQDPNDPYKTCVPSSGSCSGFGGGGGTGGFGGGGGTGGSGGGTGGFGGGGSGGTSGGGGTGGSTTTCTDTWASYGQAFFANNCAKCHSWAGSHSSVQSKLSSITGRIQSGSMPPGGISAADKQKILAYLGCGAP